MASPFHSILVDDEGELRFHGKIPGQQPFVLLAVNGISMFELAESARTDDPTAWKVFFNAMLPSLLRAANAPLQETARVLVHRRDGTEESIELPVPEDKSEANVAVVSQQYAAIIALAKQCGLSQNEIGCVFATVAHQLGVPEVNPTGNPLNMMQGMAEAMGGGSGQAGCPQQ